MYDFDFRLGVFVLLGDGLGGGREMNREPDHNRRSSDNSNFRSPSSFEPNREGEQTIVRVPYGVKLEFVVIDGMRYKMTKTGDKYGWWTEYRTLPYGAPFAETE